MIRLSIIVPLYKSEKYLPKCIESLVQQDIPLETYEIILVNDGSPDNSKTIAEEYASRYSNIKVLSQENKGASGARNTGLSIAVGEYVRFVDPDDFVPKYSFRDFLAIMDKENLDMLRFNYQVVDEAYNEIPKLASAQRVDYRQGIMDGISFLNQQLGYACFIWTFVYRRTLLHDNGIMFYEGDYYDDTPWMPRVCQKAERVDKIDTIGYYYYQRSDSLVKSVDKRSIQKKIDGQIFLIEELQKQLLQCPKANDWYRGMTAHCVVSLLNLIGTYQYDKRKEVFAFLKRQKVYPLSTYQAMPKTARKISIINISQRFFCWMIHIKKGQVEE